MALVNDPAIQALATAIVESIIGASLPPAEKAIIVAAKKKEITLLLQYFVANAQVIVTSVTAVTPGPGVSGPGLGTVL